ncbi:restriction endonuclease subunit S [Peribacillus simplex]|uniref:restriction endonuclease subunit S n=1 Tax=Peribacillus simplex TaxID=1478 RepID=UPI00115F94D5|nr:restriction endonuclease subunit S [Peribacillus simplex]
MWIITIHSKNGFKMFEFYTEKEAKEKFEVIEGCKILSEVIYLNDKQLVKP